MWIVRLALRRPYTFVVAALLLLLLTPFVLLRTPTDIFPAITIPVVSVVWQYTGLTAREIEQRMVFTEERALTTTVNNIEHIESTSYDGVGVVKIFFQPGVSPDGAVAEVTAESQTILKQLPPGTTPPLIIQYNASTVPILQHGISSPTLSEQQTFRVTLNTIRVGYMPQQNVVRQDGVRSTMVSVLKNGSASTLQVASGVKAAMAAVMKTVTDNLQVKQFADQSLFVQAAVSGVVREGVIAAALTALMILLFLGSWRSTLIIAISIPLSVLASLAILSAIGETINLMTLGGLALAVALLVDDATVTIENVERHLQAGESLENGIMIGAGEIALPAMVSTLCICIGFAPMFFLTGVARYLFAPLAEAVVFAVLASYLLSRTLVPTLVMWFGRSKPKIENPKSKIEEG